MFTFWGRILAGGGANIGQRFLLRMRDSRPWLLAEGRQSEADAVKKVLEFRLQAASAALFG